MAGERLAEVVTSLGDALMLQSMSGREELSRPFSYELELISEDPNVAASKLLGTGATVEVELGNGEKRYFHGLVSRFVSARYSGRYITYRAELRPWLWLLSRTSDCRIFQNITVPDLIKQVFRDFGLTDFDEALTARYRTWEYLVQYRETSLNFISRLMEQEGIYYYFKHESGKHTLILADGYNAHEPAPGYETVPYYPPDQLDRRERDHLTAWSATEQIQSAGCMLNDFDFTRPKASLQAKISAPAEHAWNSLLLYDYPGEYTEATDGEAYAKSRLQALLAEYKRARGNGNARGLCAGNLFTLSGFPRDDQNREYLIVGTDFLVENSTRESAPDREARVESAVTVIESRTQFRAPQQTPKPTISGPQTAIVVGKAGEEIWTDEYGRVKVQFHWDRLGKADEDSSCWVRVAQIWAGSHWGAMHIPRIGQEVIIEFLEGDPDRPIVTGRLYNGDNKPPEDLPANQTQSGIKSRSTLGGGADNFNALRFEDKKGAEQVFMQAEKDLSEVVKNDHSTSVGANQTNSVTKDQTESVGGNQTLSVTGNRTVHVTGSQSVTIDGSQAADGVSGGKVGITGDYKVDASNTIAVQAPVSIKLECGGSSIMIEPGKITIAAGGKAQLVLDVNALLSSSQGTQTMLDANARVSSSQGTEMLLDANALLKASGNAQVLLDANALTQSSAGSKVLLDANALTQASSGGEVFLDANAMLAGKEATVSGDTSAQLTAGGLVKADAGGVNIEGSKVKIN